MMLIRAIAIVVLLAIAGTAAAVQLAWLPPPAAILSRLDARFAEAATPEKNEGEGRRAQQPPLVEVEKARVASTTRDIEAVGSLLSDESVEIASEIAGRVAEIAFKEGQPVEEGATLVKLDDRLARAEVDDAKARFDLAVANNERAKALSQRGHVTERAADEAVSNLETARAALELARVRLSKHELKAPFSGVVGTRRVSPGAYLAAGAPIVNLEKIDTLKADFKIPETFLGDVRVGQEIALAVDALPRRTFAGEIYAINPQVDVNGRSLQIRARIANPERLLRPGLFARIRVKGLEERSVVMAPESAVVPRGGESFVYRVENGRVVEQKVKLGERRDGSVEIVEGLDGAALVVTAGQQRLRDGAEVEIVAADAKAAARGRS
jgi:membrane fusion protein (multidrug efflux system)